MTRSILINNVNLPVRKILIGIIKSYVRLPISMIIKSKMDISKFDNSKLNLPKDFLNSYAFIGKLYKRLSIKIGKDKAFEIMRIALGTVAFSVQQHNFKTVEEGRSFLKLIRNQKRANSEGSTKLNTMKIIEESNSIYRFKVTNCMFYHLFNELEVPELTSIMCSIDNAIFNFYSPNNVIFSRTIGNTIYDGKNECEFVIKNIT